MKELRSYNNNNNNNRATCPSRPEAPPPRVMAGETTPMAWMINGRDIREWVEGKLGSERENGVDTVVGGHDRRRGSRFCSPLGMTKWLRDSRVRAGEFAAC